MSPEKIASLADVAELLSVHKNTALRYTQRDDFPEPFDTIATGPVWLIDDVERWAEEHLGDDGRLPRGPQPKG